MISKETALRLSSKITIHELLEVIYNSVGCCSKCSLRVTEDCKKLYYDGCYGAIDMTKDSGYCEDFKLIKG